MKDTSEPLIDSSSSGKFKVKPDAIAKICNTDASHRVEKGTKGCNETDIGKMLSSKLLLTDFEGYDNIAKLLDTDLHRGIDKNSIKDRQ
jgi:hypothetical protein